MVFKNKTFVLWQCIALKWVIKWTLCFNQLCVWHSISPCALHTHTPYITPTISARDVEKLKLLWETTKNEKTERKQSETKTDKHYFEWYEVNKQSASKREERTEEAEANQNDRKIMWSIINICVFDISVYRICDVNLIKIEINSIIFRSIPWHISSKHQQPNKLSFCARFFFVSYTSSFLSIFFSLSLAHQFYNNNNNSPHKYTIYT